MPEALRVCGQETPLQIAEAEGNSEAVAFLESMEAGGDGGFKVGDRAEAYGCTVGIRVWH